MVSEENEKCIEVPAAESAISHFSDIINEPVSSVSWSIIKGWLSGIVA